MPMDEILTSLNKLEEYVGAENYKGYDPYDTLLSPLLIDSFR